MTTIPSPKILLVGAGYMAMEYAKVLKSLKKSFLVVGRSEESALDFEKATGVSAAAGGIENWLKQENHLGARLLSQLRAAIIATNEDQLGLSARLLIQRGVKSILLEKPGGLNRTDLEKTKKLATEKKVEIFVAFNRRFYASTFKAQEIIKKDGEATSFKFDFTERSNLIEKSDKSVAVKREWLLANSSHVIDLAFFLGGKPKKINSYKTGKLNWHPNGSIYAGSGISQSGALFSYHANWESAGRWEIEIMTPKHKLIFKPLEQLQIQKIGSMAVKELPINDKLDMEFKPGLYRLVKSFLTDQKNLPTIAEQMENLKYYELIESHV